MGTVTVVDHSELTVEGVDQADLVVFSGGGEFSINGFPSYHANRALFLRNLVKPYIGVCYGAELLAHIYGTTLHPTERVKGVVDIRMEANYSFKHQGYKVFENHRFCINDISRPLESVAYSKNGVEVFKHVDKPHWGVQFHPEVMDPENDGSELFKEILEKVC